MIEIDNRDTKEMLSYYEDRIKALEYENKELRLIIKELRTTITDLIKIIKEEPNA
jgi:prefoldin subunit 5